MQMLMEPARYSKDYQKDAEHWIDKCLEVDESHVKARLTKAALRFYLIKVILII